MKISKILSQIGLWIIILAIFIFFNIDKIQYKYMPKICSMYYINYNTVDRSLINMIVKDDIVLNEFLRIAEYYQHTHPKLLTTSKIRALLSNGLISTDHQLKSFCKENNIRSNKCSINLFTQAEYKQFIENNILQRNLYSTIHRVLIVNLMNFNKNNRFIIYTFNITDRQSSSLSSNIYTKLQSNNNDIFVSDTRRELLYRIWERKLAKGGNFYRYDATNKQIDYTEENAKIYKENCKKLNIICKKIPSISYNSSVTVIIDTKTNKRYTFAENSHQNVVDNEKQMPYITQILEIENNYMNINNNKIAEFKNSVIKDLQFYLNDIDSFYKGNGNSTF